MYIAPHNLVKRLGAYTSKLMFKPFWGALVAWFTSSAIGAAIVNAVVSYAISYVVNRIFGPDEPEAQKDQGVKQRLPSDPANKLPVVYGEKRIAGQLTMADIKADNQVMYFIIALSEGPVEAINKVYWEDKELSFATSLSSTVQNVTNATDGDGTSHDFLNDGRMKVAVFPAGGRCAPMEAKSSKWKVDKADRAMPNTAYAYVELTYDREKRVTGLSNGVQFNVKGRKVKVVQSDGTLASTETYSNNPADCLADYLVNTKYGANILPANLDLDSFYSHGQFCNEIKSYTDNSGSSASAKRYTVNGVINTNLDLDRNISDLTVGNNASFNWNLGQFAIVTEGVKISTDTFSEDNIYGGIVVSGRGFDSKLNKLTARFDSIQDHEQESQVILTEPPSNKNDNEPVLESTITLPFTNNNIEAERAAAVILNQSRQSLVASFTTDIGALGNQAGDVISITHSTVGWNAKKFKIISLEESNLAGGYGINVVAQEYADAVYSDRSINQYDVAPNTNFPDPYAAPTVSSVNATEDASIQASNLLVTWADTNTAFNDKYIIGYRLTSDPVSFTTYKTVSGGLRYEISPLAPSQGYTITVKPVSTLGVEGAVATVTGSTSASRVTGLTQKGEWPATGSVTVSPGDIYTYDSDLWFYTGSAAVTLDAATTNPDDDNTINDRWSQVDIPAGESGTSAFVWIRIVGGKLQYQTTTTDTNPDATADPAWVKADTTGVDVSGPKGDDGDNGADGDPSLSYTIVQDNRGGGNVAGAWAINDGVPVSTWTTDVNKVFINKSDSTGTDNSTYFDTLTTGDYLTFTSTQATKTGKAICKITSTSKSGDTYVIGIETLRVVGVLNALAGGDGTNVNFGWSRSPSGANGLSGTSVRLDIAYFHNSDGSLSGSETNSFPTGRLVDGDYTSAAKGIRNYQGTNAVTWVSSSTEPEVSTTVSDYEKTQITGNSGLATRLDVAYSDNADGTGNTQRPTGRHVDGDYSVATAASTNLYIGTDVVSWTNTEPEVSTTDSEYEWVRFVPATWHSGSGEPAGSLGNVGDFYLRTSDESVYKKTATSTWTVDITTLRGNNGANGDNHNWIFRDSPSKPSKPAPSSGVPAAWVDSTPGSISNTLWASLGVQTASAGNFVWGEVIQMSGEDGVGIAGTRNAHGTVYFGSAVASAPSKPTGSTYNYTSGLFGTLTTNWTTDAVAVVANQTAFNWQCTYNVSEATLGGPQTITFGTVTKVATFTNVLASGGIAAGQSIKVGNLVTNSSAQPTSGSGAILTGGGDFTVGNATKNVSFDSSSGTMTVVGDIIGAGNIVIDGTSMVNNNGTLQVGTISPAQVTSPTTNLGIIDTTGGDDQSQTFSNGVSITSLTTNGADGGSSGGDVEITATSGDIVVDSFLRSEGGNGADKTVGSGGNGGNAGAIVLTATNGNIQINPSLSEFATSVKGGNGGNKVAGSGGDGGNGGSITLSAPNGCIIVNGTTITGPGTPGTGGSGSSPGEAGSGGSTTQTHSTGNICKA